MYKLDRVREDMAFNEGILDSERPNFFELLAVEAMQEAFRPAVEYVCKVIARSRLRHFGVLWRSRDELHLLLESALQSCFLSQCDGSFAENFYCLRRLSTGREGGESDRLSLRRKYLSLLGLVMIPYLKVKVERLYSILTDENDSSPILWSRGQSSKVLLKFIIFKSVPYLLSLWTTVFFVFRLRYLMTGFHYYSPLHWMAGVKIVRQTEPSSHPMVSWPWLAGQVFSLTLFGLRLLQWWYSGERETTFRKMTSLPIPPPPPPRLCSEGAPLPSDLSSCPLCHHPRREPTALSTSGHVFCWDCITDYVTTHGRCPLTDFPSSQKQLIRLFIDHQSN